MPDTERELERAYRALYGFYSCHMKGEKPNDAMLAYHSPVIGAAARLVKEQRLDGADYFEGKPVEVLHAALKL